jgi:Zn-dependent M16 (insulinase) family peptidase
MRAYAPVSFAASLNDALSGLTQAQFMQKLEARLTGDANAADECVNEILQGREARISDLLARAHHLGADVWAVCDPRHSEAVGLALRDFRRAVTADTKVVNRTPRTMKINNSPRAQLQSDRMETIELPINASYAGAAFVHGRSYMSREQQALRLGLQILKSEYLHTQIRELGGAYGVTTEATMGGIAGGIALATYRDPSPQRSLEVFNRLGEWLSKPANVTQQRLDEAKLRLFGSIDHPVTCSSYGSKKRLSGLTEEGEQRIRDMLLDISVTDVLSLSASVFAKPATHSAVLAPKRHMPDEGTANTGSAHDEAAKNAADEQ